MVFATNQKCKGCKGLFKEVQYSLLSLSYWFNIDFLTKEAKSETQNLPDWSENDRRDAKI